MTDIETMKCCRGVGDHEEWCHRYAQDSGPAKSNLPRNTSRKLAKRVKRARAETRRRERALLDARARILTEESERSIEAPSRINSALSGVGNAVNAAMQDEDSWRRVWSEP